MRGAHMSTHSAHAAPAVVSDRHLNDSLSTPMGADSLRQEFLAEIDLRLRVVGTVALVPHDLEPQVVERTAHVVELVFRLDDDFVEPVLNRPELLLLRERAEEALSAPVTPGTANPCIQHPPAVELHVVLQSMHQI